MFNFLKITIYLFFMKLIFLKISFACDYQDLYKRASRLLIDVPPYSATNIKEHTFSLAGKILIKERIYKTSDKKVRVRIFWGEELPPKWKNLVFNLLGISENHLKEISLNGVKAKLFEKEEKKAIIFPVLEDDTRAFLIVFSSRTFSLENLKEFCQRFRIKEFLASCS